MASYCIGCGASLPEGARFCSACGKAVPGASFVEGRSAFGSLIRPLAGRKLAGVCQALANQYGWDVTLVRVIAVLLAVGIFPIGLLLYLMLWIMVPQEQRLLPSSTHIDNASPGQP